MPGRGASEPTCRLTRCCLVASIAGAVLIGVAGWPVVIEAGAPPAAQAGEAVATPATPPVWRAPRTPWGDPDLQGTYTNRHEANTPIERDDRFAGRRHDQLSKQEIAAFRRDRAAVDRPAAAVGAEWTSDVDAATGQRAWMVVDPPDGRIPPNTAAGARRIAASLEARRARPRADSYEDRDVSVRCITRGLVTSMLPTASGGSYEIVQSPGYVTIRYEVIHETRVIPLDGRPMAGPTLRMDMGDARGRWDGDSLVIETTNLSDRSAATMFGASGATLRVTERFNPASATTLQWTATLDDPATWTSPWSISLPLTRDDAPVFEYACHEGNYAMRNILSAARADERRWWGLRRVAIDAAGPLRGIGRPWAIAAGMLALVCGGVVFLVGIRRVRARRSRG